MLSHLGTIAGDLADLYRDLHANPELSFAEHRTAALVAARARDMGYEVTEGVGRTGVVAVLRNGSSRRQRPAGPTVLLRADMDALPVQEATGLPYASTRPGVMHACGHDMHMAILMGTAEVLSGMRGSLARGYGDSVQTSPSCARAPARASPVMHRSPPATNAAPGSGPSSPE